MDLPKCPQCNEDYTYKDGHLFVCPMCSYEWTEAAQAASEEAAITRDCNGNVLENGDAVSVIRDLKLGSSDTIKLGTRVRNIRILDEKVDGHDILAKVDPFGQVYLKSHLLKK